MLTAITRRVGATLGRCELVYVERRPIDAARAAGQHRDYEQCLRDLGARVISLAPEPDLPDGVFVEDPAVVLDEVAVITRMGAASRRAESETVARALEPFRPLRRIQAPGTLEGGDVLRAGSGLYAGMSVRSNAEGIAELRRSAEPFGYRVTAVEVRGAMHLKTACCYLGRDTLLANGAWIDLEPLAHFRILVTAPDEPWAANVVAIGDSLIMPDAFPATRRLLERDGWKIQTIELSELMKAEAGVTCLGLLFEAPTPTGTLPSF